MANYRGLDIDVTAIYMAQTGRISIAIISGGGILEFVNMARWETEELIHSLQECVHVSKRKESEANAATNS